MSFPFNLAVKSIRRHPVQSFLAVSGIALGVAVILAVLITNATLRRSMEKTVAELGTGNTKIWVEEGAENSASIGSRLEGFSQGLIPALLKQPGVASVHPSLRMRADAAAPGRPAPIQLHLYGVDLANDAVIRNHRLAQGRYPSQPREAMIGETAAAKLGLSVGAPFLVRTPKGLLRLRAAGFLASGSGSGMLHNNRVAFADLQAVQESFGYRDRITSLNIVLHSGIHPRQAAADIKTLIPAGLKVYTDPLAELAETDETGKLRTSAVFFAFMASVVACFIIHITLNGHIEQNRKEIGCLRLLGMTGRQVARYVLAQSLIYGVLGAAIGILLGIGMSFALVALVNLFLPHRTLMPGLPSPGAALAAAGIGLLATVAVGQWPAFKAAGIPPMSIFHRYEPAGSPPGVRLTAGRAIGLLALVLGLVLSSLPALPPWLYARFAAPAFVFPGLCVLLEPALHYVLKPLSVLFFRLFGLPGLLAVGHLHLRRKSTTATAGALMVALAVCLGFLGMTASFKGTIAGWLARTEWADLIIFSNSGAEIEEQVLASVHGSAFVKRTDPLRYLFVPYRHEGLSDHGFLFQGMDPETIRVLPGLKSVVGDRETIVASLGKNPAILVNEGLARAIGVEPGDRLRLETGKGPADFEILGLVTDHSDFIHRMGKIVYGSRETLARYWGIGGFTVIRVGLVEGYPRERAKQQLIAGLTGRYDLRIITSDEERAEVGRSIDRVFGIFYAINLVVLLIVGMSVFNTIFLNVLAQIREFGLLRITGCTPRQIGKIVLLQGLALVSLGTVAAAAAGFWLAGEMTAGTGGVLGLDMERHTPVAMMAGLLLLAAAGAAAATLYPRRLAAGLSIPEVLGCTEHT